MSARPRMTRTRRWLRVGLRLGLGGLIGSGAGVQAQTGAVWRRPPTDVSTYRTLDECIGAYARVMHADEERGYWTPLPDSVGPTMARCLARYSLKDLVASGYPLDEVFAFLLAAQRDREVATLVAQRQAAVPATDTAGRLAIEDALATAYRRMHRQAETRQLLEERLRRETNPPRRVGAYAALIYFAEESGDTALALRHRRQIVAEWEQAPTAYQPGMDDVLRALLQVRRRELLDSLAQSTTSYLATLHRFLDAVWGPGGAPPEQWASLQGAKGQPAPPIVGDYWFRRGTGSDSTRPTPGRVNLVVFTGARGETGDCVPRTRLSLEEARRETVCPNGMGDLLVLRQLAQRFPALAITVLGRTKGAFVTTAYEPAQEAEQLRRWLHDGLQVPGVLAITRGTFRRRPAPDRRLTHLPDANDKAWPAGSYVFLVDHNGVIVSDHEGLDANGPFAELVDATLRQHAGVGASAPHP